MNVHDTATTSLTSAKEDRAHRLERLIAYAKHLARQQNERDKLYPRPRADDYHADENDIDKAYHGGWL